ncbi:hypothetical protein GCM10028791_06750 [Echinicola sediminis]
MENKKVLIVDDNNMNRKVFENIISHNYLFDTAENGYQAIQKIRQQFYDIILMDIQMPVMDGISTLKAIKEEGLRQGPVIAISAFSNQNDREYFLSAGFDEFITKPVKPKNLLESIYFHLHKDQKASSKPSSYKPEKILDQKIYDQIIRYNSKQEIKTVYKDFFTEAKCLLKEIEELIEAENFSEIGEKLHILKGNSGTLGAKQLFIHTGLLEQKIRDAKFEDIMEDYITLQKELNVFIELLNKLNDQLSE